MARGEDDLGSHMEEDLPSSSSEDVPSCADAVGVITWLRPVGELWVDAFWKKFSFPPNVKVLFSSSRPCVASCIEDD